MAGLETSFSGFVSEVVLTKLVPVMAGFLVLKATLDTAEGQSPLASVIAAMFLLSVPATIQMMQRLNSGSEFATTDMLVSLWNYLAGTILPAAAGLAVVGAIINYARQKPVLPLVYSALAFLSGSGLWRLVQAMVG